MRLVLILGGLALLTSCGGGSASCTDRFLADLPDLIGIEPPASTTVAADETIVARAVVDDATRFVRMQLRSTDSDQVVGTGSAPSGTADPETVEVSIKVDESAPGGAYYLSADVCAADQCPDDQPRTEYRLGSDPNFLQKTRIQGSDGVESSCVVVYRITVE